MSKTDTKEQKAVAKSTPVGVPKTQDDATEAAIEKPDSALAKVKKESKLKGFAGVIIMGSVNIISLIVILWLMSALPARAVEFNQLRTLSQEQNVKNAVEVARSELDALHTDITELSSFYPDESGMVGFVQALESLKEGSVVSYTFASKDPVKDETGALAVPVIIEFLGTWSEVDSDLATIEQLPYVIRFVDVEALQVEGDSVELKYGGFIYVDEDFNKN